MTADDDLKAKGDPGATVASVDALSPHEKEILHQFRASLEEDGFLKPGDTLGTTDPTLIRFLRARKFNLHASRKMIIQCLAWRHSVEGKGLDALYDEIDPFDFDHREEVYKYWPMWFHKTDRLGRPINIQLFGAFDLDKLYQVVEPDYHWKSILVNCEVLTREVLPACSRATGRQIDNCFCIVDLKGFSIKQFWSFKSLARACFSITQDRFPETMGYLAIINANRSFAAIWHAIKPWLAKETVAKINVLDDRYEETLLHHIAPENLPTFFGGTCTCEGKGGCSLSSAGPWLEGRDWKGKSWKRNYPDLVDQLPTSKPAAAPAPAPPTTNGVAKPEQKPEPTLEKPAAESDADRLPAPAPSAEQAQPQAASG